MPIGTPYIPDTAAVDVVVDPLDHVTVTASMDATALVSANLGGNVKTPTSNFNLHYGHQIISFTKGLPVNIDDGVLVAINTAYSNSPPLA